MKRRDLSQIMTTAWQFYRVTRLHFSWCLRHAWKNFKLVERMRREVVKFYFTKVNGYTREAWGTLREDIVLPTKGNRRKNDTVQVYFDTEKMAYRCFKKLNLA
jgi:hypothetical protein